MLTKLRQKIRSLIEDFTKSDFQTFIYTNSAIFTIAEPNIVAITSVLINGNLLQSGESYSYSPTTKKITISGVSFNVNDSIEVNFTFTRYSDTELDEYIRASLVWMSIYDYTEGDFEIETIGIYPTPSNKEEDMICIIVSILINPDMTNYKLPNVSIAYPAYTPKEERIQDLIQSFKHGIGAVGIVKWHTSYYDSEFSNYLVLIGITTETKFQELIVYQKTNTTWVLEIQTKLGYLTDLTGGTVYVTVKENMEDVDNNAKIKKDLTAISPTTGRININFDATDSDLVGNYYYDIKYVDGDGNSYILFRGKMKFVEAVTKRA